MINRSHFLAVSTAGVLAATLPASARKLPSFRLVDRIQVGARLSLAEMAAQYPSAVSGDLLQYELGFGATYDKQIGFGHETDGDQRLFFVETQVGNGDHACNPNTLKKVYLKGHAFGAVFSPYAALSYVTRSGNMLTRWGDGVGPDATDMLLLDAKALYDPRRALVTHVRPASIVIDGRRLTSTHVTATYPSAIGSQLRMVDVWLSADVPLGVVKMVATAPDVDPFNLSVYKFARHFKSELAMSLTTIRALTPTGDVPVIQ